MNNLRGQRGRLLYVDDAVTAEAMRKAGWRELAPRIVELWKRADARPYILRDPDGRVLSRVAKTAPLSWQTRATTERTDYTFAVLFPTYMGAMRASQGQGGTPEPLPPEL